MENTYYINNIGEKFYYLKNREYGWNDPIYCKKGDENKPEYWYNSAFLEIIGRCKLVKQ